MTPAQSAALRIGAALERLNVSREWTAATMVRGPRFSPMQAYGASWLLVLARLDAKRRELRELLAAALELVALDLAHDPSGCGCGRHVDMGATRGA